MDITLQITGNFRYAATQAIIAFSRTGWRRKAGKKRIVLSGEVLQISCPSEVKVNCICFVRKNGLADQIQETMLPGG